MLRRLFVIALVAVAVARPSGNHLWAGSTNGRALPDVTIGIRGEEIGLKQLGYRPQHFLLYRSILDRRMREEKFCRMELATRYFSGFEIKIHTGTKSVEHCVGRLISVMTDEFHQNEFEKALYVSLIAERALAGNEGLAGFARLIFGLQSSSSAARATFLPDPRGLSEIKFDEVRRLQSDFPKLSKYVASINPEEARARTLEVLGSIFSEVSNGDTVKQNGAEKHIHLGLETQQLKKVGQEPRDAQVALLVLVRPVSDEEEKYINAVIVRLCNLAGDRTFAAWLDGVARTCFLHAIDGRSSWVFIRFKPTLYSNSTAVLRRYLELNVLPEIFEIEFSSQKRKVACADAIEALLRGLTDEDCGADKNKIPAADGGYFLLEVEGARKS
jgi:hypothetical protein